MANHIRAGELYGKLWTIECSEKTTIDKLEEALALVDSFVLSAAKKHLKGPYFDVCMLAEISALEEYFLSSHNVTDIFKIPWAIGTYLRETLSKNEPIIRSYLEGENRAHSIRQKLLNPRFLVPDRGFPKIVSGEVEYFSALSDQPSKKIALIQSQIEDIWLWLQLHRSGWDRGWPRDFVPRLTLHLEHVDGSNSRLSAFFKGRKNEWITRRGWHKYVYLDHRAPNGHWGLSHSSGYHSNAKNLELIFDLTS